MVNPICRCGHYRSIHNFFDNGDSFCTDYTKHKYRSCKCKGYKLDNLRYLEQLSD